MKNIRNIISLLIITGVAFLSCDDSTIELDPIGDTEAGFFQTEEQMTQAVLGTYQKLTFFYTFRGGPNNFLQAIWQLPGDDLTTEANHPHEFFSGLNGNNGQLNAFYRFSYQLIARANTLMQKIEENGSIAYENQPELMDYHRGEVLFLRAWMYFKLWNTYGTAPLVRERIVALENAFPPNSQGTELLDQAILDLEEAAQILPEAWGDANKGRVTRNSALGLRGKALVFRGTVTGSSADFTSAIQDFDAISGVSLTSNYGDNFNTAMENNEESLFEFQANNQAGINNVFLDNDSFAVVGDIGAYYGHFVRRPTWVGNTVYSATSTLMDEFEPGDPRINYIFDPEPGLVTNVVKYIKDGNWTNNPGGANGSSRNNPRILRYADILLLKAEATVRSGGNLSEAVALLNQIRERARMSAENEMSAVPSDYTLTGETESTVLEWIFKERRMELACEEGHRWYDLRRRHLAGEIDLKTWDFDSKRIDLEFEDFHVNFPLPEIEVIENENMNQNAGY
ncbi:RagB/SusD family nutrient uptake outer membrane protein [Cyclobacterium plantarum]|uniref:RagB/SusD family nutrient uptake outer membrane protein n=1 Tax=Cyclobacterium plantarum TaxID=2716263 RepID=A0ABX0H864_9BACT|nr:RagB/SusD family nutrient uptake outer membrane protein [Cyclobacterium plantarum]NHE56583.1 RagB/SusD family nutrient uptake outer membrane protein [Cyclobacterium plantarum]